MSIDIATAIADRHRRLAGILAASARWSIALAAICAGGALIGWALGIELLARFVPGWPEVKLATAAATFVTAGAFALLLSEYPRKHGVGVLILAVTALAVLAAILLPEAQRLPGGALPAYPGSALLLILAAVALVTTPGTKQLTAVRLLAAASAVLLFLALIGISYRLLLALPPLVDISLPSLIALLLLTYATAVVRPDPGLLERLTTERPGAVITRRLLPAVLLLPLVIGWLELAGEGSGMLDSAFGSVLQTVVTIFGLGALVLWGARRLDRLDVERDEAERQAHAQREWLRVTISSCNEAVVATDPSGIVRLVNPAAEALVGRTSVELVGHPVTETFPLCSGEEAIEHPLSTVLRGATYSDGRRGLKLLEGANERYVEVSAAPINSDERALLGAVMVMRDVSVRRQEEQALRDAYAELDLRVEERTAALERLMAAEQRLRLEAERANRAKDEFLAIVSHELRSPLNALRGWGFLLGSAKTPDESLIERATQAIKRNVDHQARLIEDLLDTSRIMSGKLNIERRPVNLVEVLQAAHEGVKLSAAAKRITVELDSELPAINLEGDAARLQQIAVNLLSNAVKFTPEGGEVKVTLRIAGGVARIAVSDTGTGIAPEFLPHVFDRFSQADTSTTRRHGGLGIGLALVRHLTELHGGKVSAQSEGAGKGSTFSVELPLPEGAQREESGPAATPTQPAGTGGLAGVSICALDDDPDARDVIGLTLRQAGARVRTVASGAELIAVLDQELPEERPDVLLMDLAMPDEDGFAVLARVRALEARKAAPPGSSIPAIAVTAFTEVSRDRVIEQGFLDHVSKPIDTAKLVASIRRAMAASGRTPRK